MSKIEEAAEKKRSGKYNCAQAICCTYCDGTGMSEDEMRAVAQAFAVGMGTLEGTCGAIIGAGIVLGLVNRDGSAIRQMREIMNEFTERNGTVICKELKGMGGKPIRACDDCVRDAAEFLERRLKGE